MKTTVVKASKVLDCNNAREFCIDMLYLNPSPQLFWVMVVLAFTISLGWKDPVSSSKSHMLCSMLTLLIVPLHQHQLHGTQNLLPAMNREATNLFFSSVTTYV